MINVLKIFIVLFLLPVMVSGQVLNDSVVKYNRIINKAELSICDSDFIQANKLYAQAFKLNPDKAFSYDLFTAFHCAMDAQDYIAADAYLEKLLVRGIDTGFLDMGILSFYTGKKRHIIDSIIAKYPNNINRNDWLNTTITKLGHRDQEFRIYYAKKSEDGDYMNKSVYEVDSQNAHQLFQIIQTLGHFPNANEVRNEDDYPLAGTYVDLILLHNLEDYFMGKQQSLFGTLSYQAIQTFDYSTKRFVNLLSHCYFRKNGGYNDFHYKNIPIDFPVTIVAYKDMQDGGKVYFETLTSEEENRINAEREKLGLSTLQELRKKVNFDYLQHFNEGKYFAFGGTSVITFKLSTHKQILEDLSKSNPIQEYKP